MFFGWGRPPQPSPIMWHKERRHYIYRMIIALTQSWHDLLRGADEEKRNLSSCATVWCIITDRELEADLIIRWHLRKKPLQETNRGGKKITFKNSHKKKRKVHLCRCCRGSVFLYFPLVRAMRYCNLFFWPGGVGQAQSGFNHKNPLDTRQNGVRQTLGIFAMSI